MKNNKGNKPAKSASASTSSASTNPLADKLGKDGKLTKEERQRRYDNNLCMFCGGVGHTAGNCNKASSFAAKAKARAAQAKEKESPKGDSKKVVFGSPVRSGLLTLPGMDRDRDWSSKLGNRKKPDWTGVHRSFAVLKPVLDRCLVRFLIDIN